MMDYSKWTDFAINKRVLALKSEIKPLAYPHNADDRSAGIVDINGDYHWFDFCNNAADAWPIILENEISINYCQAEGEWLAHADGLMKEGCWCWDVEPSPFFLDISPLRAAMIVFLMMREGE